MEKTERRPLTEVSTEFFIGHHVAVEVVNNGALST